MDFARVATDSEVRVAFEDHINLHESLVLIGRRFLIRRHLLKDYLAAVRKVSRQQHQIIIARTLERLTLLKSFCDQSLSFRMALLLKMWRFALQSTQPKRDCSTESQMLKKSRECKRKTLSYRSRDLSSRQIGLYVTDIHIPFAR